MRQVFLALILAMAASSEQALTQHDRDYAMSQLHASRKFFLDSVAGLSPEQWNFKAGPDRWSIAECAEHIAISEDLISGRIQQSLKTPPTPEKRDEVKGKDELIEQKITDRSQKFQAPEVIRPTHRWPDPAMTIAHFKESRDRNIAYLEKTNDDLRDHFFPHPVMGLLDSYQWFLLQSAHTERHTAQINEVKADPKYPK